MGPPCFLLKARLGLYSKDLVLCTIDSLSHHNYKQQPLILLVGYDEKVWGAVTMPIACAGQNNGEEQAREFEYVQYNLGACLLPALSEILRGSGQSRRGP